MVDLLFPSAVLRVSQPEHLPAAKEVLTRYLSRVKPNMWNVCQSESMFDARLDGLLAEIAKIGFEMLQDQGYDMSAAMTSVSEFWGQEFMRNGQHMEHVHGQGVQITGFYFVSVPENSSVPVVFDPRPGKKQISLRQANPDDVTYASEQIMFKVEAGDLLFFNSWLPHGFTRHESDEPLQFIHFNVNVDTVPNVEVI